jgi:hypothetical protein
MPAYESLQSGPSPISGCSDKLVKTSVPDSHYEPRQHYLRKRESLPPPHIAHSHFVPKATVEFLMRWKKDSAIGVKFFPHKNDPDRITDLEGALHTFVTPVVEATMHGDYRWAGGHGVYEFGSYGDFQLGREVLVSALVQQDFEDDRVMMRVAMLEAKETIGNPTLPTPLLTKDKQDAILRKRYDNAIRDYLIYHLTSERRLPARSMAINERAMSLRGTLDFLARTIEQTEPKDLPNRFRSVFFHHRSYLVSLEVMFQAALHQIRNELLLLELLCRDQGYVYGFNPPAIFVALFGEHGTELLARVHVAALKYFASTTRMQQCKVFAWADFNSPRILSLIKKALESQPHIIVMSNDDLFSGSRTTNKPGYGLYTPPKEAKGAMLVIHNNSDAFGQNIETEPSGGSLDGVIGAYSSTAGSLMRDRKDLCDYLFEVPAPWP